ncbi:MAG: diacylglycerol kinase family lipid kinase [Bacteroidales bacterium]|nr:diacylglycerol kinase family lipid kinase [Bacteroidales bacterium]
MKKICFIINPISGGGRKNILLEIEKNLKGLEADIFISQYAGHATEFARENRDNYSTIVAVGGDGTVNEIASSLINCDCSLAIIPTGSGNGLAKALKIPKSVEKAINLIKKAKSEKIDCIKINDNYSFNVAGTGFDAVVAHKFADSKKRGFFSYLKIIFKEFLKNRKFEINYSINNKEYTSNCFLFTIANTSQFGNNAYICPPAIPNDGLLNLTILKPFGLWKIPILVFRLFTVRMHKSSSFSQIPLREFKILNNKEMLFHCDGEPKKFNGNIDIEIIEKAVKVIVP